MYFLTEQEVFLHFCLSRLFMYRKALSLLWPNIQHVQVQIARGWMLLTLMHSVQQQVNITCDITVKVSLGVREENDESHQVQQQMLVWQ